MDNERQNRNKGNLRLCIILEEWYNFTSVKISNYWVRFYHDISTHTKLEGGV